jgi:HEXXH motif-containing protein
MQPNHGFYDREGDLILLHRAEALDGYLGEAYGKSWHSMRLAAYAQPKDISQTKDLWSFSLLAVAAAKKSTAVEKIAPSLDRSLSTPFRNLANFESHDGLINLAIVAAHPAITEDLLTAWHPSWQESSVEAARVVSEHELSRIEAAMHLIELSSPPAASLVGEVCAAVCLLRTGATLNAGSCVSLTSKFIPGLIYFTPAPVIMTAESIVHEAAHLWLSRFELAGELYVDADRKVASPLRPDPRPVSGLLHQIWVMSNLIPFYRDLSRLSLPLITANSGKLAKRLTQHVLALEAGLSVISANENALTDRGREFVKSLTISNS